MRGMKMLAKIDRWLIRLASDRRGVTALEYGIIAGVLGLVLIAIFKRFGNTLSALFGTVSNSI